MGSIRFVLALAVCFAHFSAPGGIKIIGGMQAVQLFFICSGFYMCLTLPSYQSIRQFYISRFIRLYPPYILILVLSIGLFWFFKKYAALTFEKYPLNNLTDILYLAFANLFIITQDFVFFIKYDVGNLVLSGKMWTTKPEPYNYLFVPQAWSLALELYFYILVPFLFKLKARYIMLLCGLSYCVRIYTYKFGVHFDPWTGRFFPSELAFFLMGMLSFHLMSQIKNISDKRVIYAGLIFVFLWIIYFFVYRHFKIIGNLWGLNYKLYGGYLLFSLTIPFMFLATKKSTVDRFLGQLSFPIFISHFLTNAVATPLISPWFGKAWPKILLVVVVSIAMHYLVIEPLEKYRNRLKNAQTQDQFL